MATAVNELRRQRFQALKEKVEEWADTERDRLTATAAFLRSIQGTAERISTKTTQRAQTLALTDINDFLLL